MAYAMMARHGDGKSPRVYRQTLIFLIFPD
jgi:hypothetical protein